MSVKTTITVPCPGCGTELEAVYWQSLNADLNPDAKAQLLEGTLFHVQCPKCGAVSVVNYPMLYHDMLNKVMIQYGRDEQETGQQIASLESTIQKFEQAFPSQAMEDYTLRGVSSQNALREKAMLFDCGLDDRVIEIVKLFCLSNLEETNPGMEVETLYFMSSEEAPFAFQVITKNKGELMISFSSELYGNVAAVLASFLGSAPNKERDYIVDAKWAMGAMETTKEMD